jgi:beta-barrel assembly-enhancing protease
MSVQSHDKLISRRQFLQYSALMGAGLAGVPVFGGCAVDPVTGQQRLMLVSEQQELAIDKQHSPFQISSDYGICQDAKLNDYVSGVSKALEPLVHRPEIPYRSLCVNATYINAYAFPGGTIGITRGILLKLNNEAELASLLGHELGHINARHSSRQSSQAQVSSLILGGLSIAAEVYASGLGDLTQKLGPLVQGAFLSKYSRDNEREADALGNEYMVKAGYSSQGFVGLMEMLNALNKEKPNAALMLFATHPMSSERLEAAMQRSKGVYQSSKERTLNRERYMDGIASLRAKKQAIELLQEGERYIAKKAYASAGTAIKKSIRLAQDDYTAYVVMAKCLMAQKKIAEAVSYADNAKKLYPSETQGHYISGIANMELKKFSNAYQDFSRCEQILTGNPMMTFFMGYCLENTGKQKHAADQYMRYLKMVNNAKNQYSQHAYTSLKKWGYIQK